MVVQKNDDPECYQTVDNVSKESNSALVNTKTSSYNLLDKKNSQNTNSSQVFIFAQSLALPLIDFLVKQIVFLCVDNRLLTSEQNQLNKFVRQKNAKKWNMLVISIKMCSNNMLTTRYTC